MVVNPDANPPALPVDGARAADDEVHASEVVPDLVRAPCTWRSLRWIHPASRSTFREARASLGAISSGEGMGTGESTGRRRLIPAEVAAPSTMNGKG
jgi:hypothetical protein